MSIVLAISTFLYVNEPVAVMREAATKNSEVVSSAYYSEEIKILEELGDWLKIQTTCDAYEGWVPKNVIHTTANEFIPSAKVSRIAGLLYDRMDTSHGPILRLPFESRLAVQDSSDKRWIKVTMHDQKVGFIQRGELSFNLEPCTRDEMIALSEEFLNLPYIWGGRSSVGYDCSGFTQMLYRQMGVSIPRDSKDQMNDEQFLVVEKPKAGDLIFWGLAEDKIRHVGLSLGGDLFIHATVRENKPWIHKSSLSDPEWDGSGKGDAGYAFRCFRSLKSNRREQHA